MKHKLFISLLLVCLIFSMTGTSFAQGSLPPVKLVDPNVATKSDFGVPLQTNSGMLANPLNVSNLSTTPLINGDFEQGQYVGWGESSTHGWAVVTPSSDLPVIPHSGTLAAWLGGDDNETSTVYQNSISITSPTALRLWYWIGSVDDCGYDFGYVEINNVPIYTWNLCQSTTTNGWMPLDLDLNAYNGQTVSFTILVQTDIGYPSSLFIDDVGFYSTFADVPVGYWSENFIHSLYNNGVTSGCGVSPMMYCPDTTVTRDQMAVFLLKAKYGASYSPPAVGAGTGFSDVPTNYWAAAWIKELAAEGITGGCGSGSYCPQYPVTRDQMAVFLLRSEHGIPYSPPSVGSGTGFGDVPTDQWAAAWIKQLVTEGITAGCGSGNYCPAVPVSRAQMAVFLVRTFGLP